MDALIVPQSLVPELLPMDECIDAMAKALTLWPKTTRCCRCGRWSSCPTNPGCSA